MNMLPIGKFFAFSTPVSISNRWVAPPFKRAMTEYPDRDDDLPLFSEIATPPAPEEETQTGKRARVLEILKTGPVTPYDLEQTHKIYRGQAIIHSLRERGCVIDSEYIEGDYSYIYRGMTEVVKVTPTIQALYYQTSHWKARAKERKELDGWKCVQCGDCGNTDRGGLEAHHWRYHLFAESVAFDLITFCRMCHRALHDAIARSSVHFPRSISVELHERITNEQHGTNPT